MNRGPRDFGLLGETVSFRSTDRIPLKAWWLPTQGTPRATVIIAHGIDHTRQVMLKPSFSCATDTMCLPSICAATVRAADKWFRPVCWKDVDLLGAIQYVRARGERGPIVLMGVSYGAVACLFTAAESQEISAVVSDGAFISGVDVSGRINQYFAHDPDTNRLARAVYAAGSFPGVAHAIVVIYYLRTGVFPGWDFGSVLPAASRIKCPVLLISGERDFVAPTANARGILDALPGANNRLVTIANAVHDTTYDAASGRYPEAVLNFLDSNFPR
jgi:pimeloyl-ACP methyl ester carboxylesterase